MSDAPTPQPAAEAAPEATTGEGERDLGTLLLGAYFVALILIVLGMLVVPVLL